MNPHDLTAFFAFVDANHAKHPEGDPMRVAVPGGWEYVEGNGWVSFETCCKPTKHPADAQLIDYQAACHCMSEWLFAHRVIVWPGKSLNGDPCWIASTGQSFGTDIRLDCHDDPLAARLEAAREIENDN